MPSRKYRDLAVQRKIQRDFNLPAFSLAAIATKYSQVQDMYKLYS